MSQQSSNPRQSRPEVVFDLSSRLTPELLSLAWLHLWNSQDNPMCPIPQELSHLSEPEWHLCHVMLEDTLNLRDLMPLQ
jgi:hypothetical protein